MVQMFGNSFSQLPLDEIIRGCQQQKDGYCLELLCRAFDDKNQVAVTALYHQYHKLLFDWVHRCSASCPYPLDQEDVEDIAIKAMTKFFKHLDRVDVSSTYKHIAPALGYCRQSVKTTVIDFMRAKKRQADML
jgi:DNA-directed RNA polymerase specialized sigma24 family protein